MKPGDQRLLHAANALAVVIAAVAGWGIGGAELAKPLVTGAAVTAICILGIALGVRTLTMPGPAWQRSVGAMAFVGQLMLVGWVIWEWDPATGPFAGGVMAVLGATVVAALIDGLMQQRHEQQHEENK